MSIVKVLALLILFTAGVTKVSAQCDSLPHLGEIYHCVVLSDGTKVLFVDGSSEIVESEVSATFRVNGYTDDPCGVLLENIEFNSKSITVALGEFNTFINPNAPPSTAQIISNVPGETFPATLTIELYLAATAEARPGFTFISEGPFILRNTNVTSLPLANVRVKQEGSNIVLRSLTGAPIGSIGGVDVVLNGDEE